MALFEEQDRVQRMHTRWARWSLLGLIFVAALLLSLLASVYRSAQGPLGSDGASPTSTRMYTKPVYGGERI